MYNMLAISSTIIKDYQQQIIENNFHNICQGLENEHLMTPNVHNLMVHNGNIK